MKISDSLENYTLNFIKKNRMSANEEISSLFNTGVIVDKLITNWIKRTNRHRDYPLFSINTLTIDIPKSILREDKIDTIFKLKTESSFDVESIIYTDDEISKLRSLRESNDSISGYVELKRVRDEYSKCFEIGQKVWYKGNAGVLTFKHEMKSGDSQKWSVDVKYVQFRYVDGYLLSLRESNDISDLPIDDELNKLSTEKLLKIYKNKRDKNRGVGDPMIKRILNQREHIGSKDKNIVVVK